MKTELRTLSSDESSPTPKQFWEPAVLPYETPIPMLNNVFSQGALDTYKPAHLQSSPMINSAHFSPLEPVNRRRFHASTIMSEPSGHYKFSNSTTPPLPAVNRPIPPKRQPSHESLQFATHPAHRVSCTNPYNQFKQLNTRKNIPHTRSYTPDSFLSDHSKGKSEI